MQSIYTVSRLNGEVKKLLESGLGTVWLSGEISNLTMATSGHWYLTLKDHSAQVKCAMFRGNNSRVRLQPKNGMQVLVRAKLSLYEPRGDYQLILESMAPEGEGLLQQAFDALKFKLAAEGLFASQHKQPLPTTPTKVGLITSATGAAIHDLLSVLKRRNPLLQIIVYPSAVQGKAATAQLVKTLQTANQRNEVDVIVLGRGGGSLEDLWCFNEEALARAVFNSTIPVISAVGHEVDVTICDFVADLRAATPSAAAELLSGNSEHWQHQLQQLNARLVRAMTQELRQQQSRFQLISQQLQYHEPRKKLQLQAQRLDELDARLRRAMQSHLKQQTHQFVRLNQQLFQSQPGLRVTQLQLQQQQLVARLSRGMRTLLDKHQQKQQSAVGQLQAVSPLATLARGYSITSNQAGDVIQQIEQVRSGEILTTRVANGVISSVVK
ncbi:exodeoxyribonuclease VII large subunit [Motilimonas cestriensis]|uniref:Exodeoxyribonuclease 7 large subunit n=1 Tax=Motilimonas cestriensis TaxID=2742685 RepID=A0ABS8WGN8_9GAMM|nr:exodeoxyribonuclease VII large subunit [Motilimonas cestriensis]MCE2596764.1 exodeoxyribonuclease VII large subunit [Motilimonas cestriensis]